MTRKESTLQSGPEAADYPLDPATPPMEAHQADVLPQGAGWQFEPKWDGFRCLAFRAANHIELRAKSGKSLTRFFPEIVSMIGTLRPEAFVLDGELVVASEGAASFDALQMRLHPAASRIGRLSRETPATFIAFDLLAGRSGNLLNAPLKERRKALERFYSGNPHLQFQLSPVTLDRTVAESWLNASGGAIDGVVAKRLAGRAQHDQGETATNRRLRGGRLPLSRTGAACGLVAVGPLQ